MKNKKLHLSFPDPSISWEVFRSNGAYWFSVRHLCSEFGLDYEEQVRAIMANKLLAAQLDKFTVIDDEGTMSESIYLPFGYVHGWLCKIDVDNTMSEETQEKLNLHFMQCCFLLNDKHIEMRIKQLKG